MSQSPGSAGKNVPVPKDTGSYHIETIVRTLVPVVGFVGLGKVGEV